MVQQAPALHDPILARHAARWVHGQVVEVAGRDLVVQLAEGGTVRCRATSAHRIDPVIALIFGRTSIEPKRTLAAVRAAHASVLSRLLGDSSTPRVRPTRDLAKLLHGLVADEDVPLGESQCTWIEPESAVEHQFPLQHAVDFVYVNESSASRISRAVRNSVGTNFFSPPTRDPPPTNDAPRAQAALRPTAPDSIFDADSDVELVSNAPTEPPRAGTVDAAEALVLKALARYPDALKVYLAARDRVADAHVTLREAAHELEGVDATPAGRKRNRMDVAHHVEADHGSTQRSARRHTTQDDDRVGEDDERDGRPRKRRRDDSFDEDDASSKEMLTTTARQRGAHAILHDPEATGTSPHEFVKSLLVHVAVVFAPHPAVLSRLYDFQFGVLGLSIMHLIQLDPTQKMEWVMATKVKGTKVNMLNFSRTVDLPSVQMPESMEQIWKALTGLKLYCDAFGSRMTCRLVQALHTAVQETTGLEFWEADDLKYLVYWIDSVLERYGMAAHDDARAGGNRCAAVVSTVTSNEPELRRLQQLVTTKKMQMLLHQNHQRSAPAFRARHDGGQLSRSKYGTARPANTGNTGADVRHRQPDASANVSRVPDHVRTLIPRYHGRELCIKFVSATGCRGSDGNANECVYPRNRYHAVPTQPLPAPVADYIEATYGGLRQGVQAALLRDLLRCMRGVNKRLDEALSRFGLRRPQDRSQSMQYTLSSLVRKSNISLPSLVRLVRGETAEDPRPNKALNPDTYALLLRGYEHQALMIDVARHGFRAAWLRRAGRISAPANHRSAVTFAAGVAARILEGETAGTYLVVDEDLLATWGVSVSPFGAIPKANGTAEDTIRLIHDLAFPLEDNVNNHTVKSLLPPVYYESIVALAQQIEIVHRRYPGVRILMLKGDVQGAFRHLRQHADDVHWMGGRLPELHAGVIDLSAPFGWTGSPAFYSVFGRAISHILSRESPASMGASATDTMPFFAYEWVDDHILIEPEIEERCSVAEDTLRLSMMAVLGPLAINEAKFTSWGTAVRALGLDWDCAARTVSMPEDKITKVLDRIIVAQACDRLATVNLLRLLGSLRHVASCLRAAKPFHQRLHTAAALAPRRGSVALSA